MNEHIPERMRKALEPPGTHECSDIPNKFEPITSYYSRDDADGRPICDAARYAQLWWLWINRNPDLPADDYWDATFHPVGKHKCDTETIVRSEPGRQYYDWDVKLGKTPCPAAKERSAAALWLEMFPDKTVADYNRKIKEAKRSREKNAALRKLLEQQRKQRLAAQKNKKKRQMIWESRRAHTCSNEIGVLPPSTIYAYRDEKHGRPACGAAKFARNQVHWLRNNPNKKPEDYIKYQRDKQIRKELREQHDYQLRQIAKEIVSDENSTQLYRVVWEDDACYYGVTDDPTVRTVDETAYWHNPGMVKRLRSGMDYEREVLLVGNRDCVLLMERVLCYTHVGGELLNQVHNPALPNVWPKAQSVLDAIHGRKK